jgi:hypothetical protein
LPRSKKFVERVFKKRFDRAVAACTGNGCADGVDGDLRMASPPFLITESRLGAIFGAPKVTFKEMEKGI